LIFLLDGWDHFLTMLGILVNTFTLPHHYPKVVSGYLLEHLYLSVTQQHYVMPSTPSVTASHPTKNSNVLHDLTALKNNPFQFRGNGRTPKNGVMIFQ